MPNTAELKARYAEYHYTTVSEIEFLQKLTDAKCPASPSLLAVKKDKQREPLLDGDYAWERKGESWVESWVPGGYIVYILMEKLPGRDLFDLYRWGYSLEQRDEVRRAFREAFM